MHFGTCIYGRSGHNRESFKVLAGKEIQLNFDFTNVEDQRYSTMKKVGDMREPVDKRWFNTRMKFNTK